MSRPLGRFQNGGRGLGPGGICICPNCGYEEAHQLGFPCFLKPCPQCGARMTRKLP